MVKTTGAEQALLYASILKGVSRSFYLTLRVLPGRLRRPIGLAYLLARAADTLADTPVLPPSQRLRHLHGFQRDICNPAAADGCDENRAALRGTLANGDEARLLQRLPELFVLLAGQPEADGKRIREVVTTLTEGMVFDLNTFPAEESGELKALQSEAELDQYTYLVAGCVGEFWTDISMAHAAALAHSERQTLVGQGVRLGKGLQLTNILRDLPRDLRIGRCYLPLAWLTQHRLTPGQLLDAGNSVTARPLLWQGIDLALQHFQAAQAYVLAIPRRCPRLRLAALWPLMIGLATLKELSMSQHWLEPNGPIKISRRRVYGIVFKSCFLVFSNAALRHWFVAARRAVTTARDPLDSQH